VFRLVVLHQLRVVDHLLLAHLALGFERLGTHAELGLLILAGVLFGVALLRDRLCGAANHDERRERVGGWDGVNECGNDDGVAVGGVRADAVVGVSDCVGVVWFSRRGVGISTDIANVDVLRLCLCVCDGDGGGLCGRG